MIRCILLLEPYEQKNFKLNKIETFIKPTLSEKHLNQKKKKTIIATEMGNKLDSNWLVLFVTALHFLTLYAVSKTEISWN